MEKNCSFIAVGGISCESRSVVKISNLFDYNENMQSHLSSCHLWKSNLKENELIAIRAGMFHLGQDNFKKISICPSHRHNLGRFWRPLRSCQYPIHSGPARSCAHFELPFKSKDKKQGLIDMISSMVKQCTCCSIKW